MIHKNLNHKNMLNKINQLIMGKNKRNKKKKKKLFNKKKLLKNKQKNKLRNQKNQRNQRNLKNQKNKINKINKIKMINNKVVHINQERVNHVKLDKLDMIMEEQISQFVLKINKNKYGYHQKK